MPRSARMDLEVKIQTGGIGQYGRIRFRIRPGCPGLRGVLQDQDGQDARALLMPMVAVLEEMGEVAGQDFQLDLERVWVHPVDSRELAYQLLARGAVRLAARYGLGGDAEWGSAWRPPRYFRVRCVQLLE
jgi:hypothetical protein